MRIPKLMLLGAMFCAACSDSEEKPDVRFDMGDPSTIVAIALSHHENTLLRIDESGEITPIVDSDVYVWQSLPARDGIYAIAEEEAYYVTYAGETHKIEGVTHYSRLMGVNSAGDCILKSSEIYSASTHTMKQLPVNLSSPYTEFVNGDFAFVFSGSAQDAQVINTVTGDIQPVNTCYSEGARVVDLSSRTVLVNDCQDQMLMDVSSGDRWGGAYGGVIVEAVPLSSGGTLVLTRSSTGGNSSPKGIDRIYSNGDMEHITDAVFEVPDAITIGVLEHPVMVASETHAIVRNDAGAAWVVDLASGEYRAILEDYFIRSIDIRGDVVYFSGKDSENLFRVGQYNVTTGELKQLRKDYNIDKIIVVK